MSGNPILEVQGLSAAYGQAQILFDVSLAVAAGEIVALMGRNGAGKSTTLKAIMGLVPPQARSLRFAGQDILRMPSYRIARLGLGYVPEERRIFTDLTVEENLEVAPRPPQAARAPRGRPSGCSRSFPTSRRCETGVPARCRAASSRC